jgi:TfoX/Sxy family transcriptional regulator of competence genes
MATEQQTADFLAEQVAGAGEIRTRTMFWEYALYVDDKVVGFVCDDQLFMKITPGSRPFLDESHDAPAYPGSKLYLRVPEDYWDDQEWLTRLARAVAADVPASKPKGPRKRQA